MQTRREFLNRSAAFLAATSLGSSAYASDVSASAFGVQLYTVRSIIAEDTAKVLSTIHEIGYRSVETFAAQYKIGAQELRKFITDAGLAVPSAHFAYADLSTRFDYAKELGAQCVVCGATPTSVADSADGFKRAANQFNLWGQQSKDLGLRFAFHNHNSEFEKFGNMTGLDIILKETDPALVQWQPDCYWITQAGSDPVTVLERYKHRLQTVHFKDRKPGFPPSIVTGKDAQHFTEVGAGTINFKAIWKIAESVGVRYFFVEQDTTEIPPLDSLRISFNNLKRILR